MLRRSLASVLQRRETFRLGLRDLIDSALQVPYIAALVHLDQFHHQAEGTSLQLHYCHHRQRLQLHGTLTAT